MLRQLIKQSLSVAGIRVVGTGLSVLVSVAIARLYGADALGVFGYCIAIMAIAAVPISNGWSTLLLRTVAGNGVLDHEAKAMIRLGGIGAILMAILAGLGALAAIHLGTSAMATALKPIVFAATALLAVTLLCDQVAAMRMASIRGYDRPVLAQLPESLVRPLILLIGLTACWWFFEQSRLSQNLWFLFVSVSVAAITSLVFGQWLLSRLSGPIKAGRVSASDRKSWFASAAALAGSAGLVQLNGYIDILILGSFVSPAETGHYRAALQIAMLASFGYVALNMLAGQRFARMVKTGDQRDLASTATYFARFALLSAFPLPAALMIAGASIFALLFGPGFEKSGLPALIIACGFTFSAAIGMARTLLVMQGNEFLVMRTTFAALLVNVVLCFVLIPHYGILGAAIANFSATVSWNALLWIVARRTSGIDTSFIGLASRQVTD